MLLLRLIPRPAQQLNMATEPIMQQPTNTGLTVNTGATTPAIAGPSGAPGAAGSAGAAGSLLLDYKSLFSDVYEMSDQFFNGDE